MPKHGGKRVVLVKGAEDAMEKFKMEVADDLGFGSIVNGNPEGFKNLTTANVGYIGGEMVRRIQAAGEWAIKQRYEQGAPRLMPEEVMPSPTAIRDISNNGNDMTKSH